MLSSSQIGSSKDGPGRILLVDDSSIILQIHSQILGASGFQCATAENGVVALELMIQEKFDAVLMDVNMPRMNGYELAKRIRQIDLQKDIPIIMVSTEKEAKDRIRGIEAGADLYMTKPIQPEALVSSLKMLLNKAA